MTLLHNCVIRQETQNLPRQSQKWNSLRPVSTNVRKFLEPWTRGVIGHNYNTLFRSLFKNESLVKAKLWHQFRTQTWDWEGGYLLPAAPSILKTNRGERAQRRKWRCRKNFCLMYKMVKNVFKVMVSVSDPTSYMERSGAWTYRR